MNRNWPKPIKSAIRELAEQRGPITAADATPYVDEDLLHAWWAVKRADDSDAYEIGEIMAEIQIGVRSQLHAAIVSGATGYALKILHDATVAYVADWLANQADDYRLDLEDEGEAEDTGDFTDPLAEERRSFISRHNAANAAWRVLP